MSTIKIAELQDPSEKFDFELAGKKYHLLPHDDMMDLIAFIESKRVVLMDKYKSLMKTAVNLRDETNEQKAIANFAKHQDEIIAQRKESEADLKQMYIDFFDTAFLDESGNQAEVGEKLAKTVGTTTALLAWINKIEALVQMQDDTINSNVDELTHSAFNAAGEVLAGDDDEQPEDAQ